MQRYNMNINFINYIDNLNTQIIFTDSTNHANTTSWVIHSETCSRSKYYIFKIFVKSLNIYN